MARALWADAQRRQNARGGVVIAPSVLTDFAPVLRTRQRRVVTQFDRTMSGRRSGQVRLPGLRTLTVLDWAVRNINLTRAAAGSAAGAGAIADG
jgi:DNA polymerase-3 subunit alpha